MTALHYCAQGDKCHLLVVASKHSGRPTFKTFYISLVNTGICTVPDWPPEDKSKLYGCNYVHVSTRPFLSAWCVQVVITASSCVLSACQRQQHLSAAGACCALWDDEKMNFWKTSSTHCSPLSYSFKKTNLYFFCAKIHIFKCFLCVYYGHDELAIPYRLVGPWRRGFQALSDNHTQLLQTKCLESKCIWPHQLL